MAVVACHRQVVNAVDGDDQLAQHSGAGDIGHLIREDIGQGLASCQGVPAAAVALLLGAAHIPSGSIDGRAVSRQPQPAVNTFQGLAGALDVKGIVPGAVGAADTGRYASLTFAVDEYPAGEGGGVGHAGALGVAGAGSGQGGAHRQGIKAARHLEVARQDRIHAVIQVGDTAHPEAGHGQVADLAARILVIGQQIDSQAGAVVLVHDEAVRHGNRRLADGHRQWDVVAPVISHRR